MAILEIEEFSTFENIVKFLNGVNMPNFIAKYFDREPDYTAAIGEIGSTVIEFQDAPLEIGISGSDAELAVFIDFRLKRKNNITVLSFIDENTTRDQIIEKFGMPDREIDEEKRIELQIDRKNIKYFINDRFSIAFDYDEKVELVSIFTDIWR